MRGNANENSTRRVWRNDGPICTCSTCSVESNRDSEWMSVSEYPNNCVKQRPSYKANLVIRLFRFQKAGSSIIEKKECLSWSKLIADSRRWVSKSSWKVGPKWFVSWLSLLQAARLLHPQSNWIKSNGRNHRFCEELHQQLSFFKTRRRRLSSKMFWEN